MENLQGHVAIVTGGGRGIGLAIAQTLSSEGVRVALIARSRAELDDAANTIEAKGGQALSLPGDVTDERVVARMVDQTVQKFGPIDLLVNNAGSAGSAGPIWEEDPEVWWRDVTTNLRGTFLCARAVLTGMVARRRGRIINVVSAFGIPTRPDSEPSPYASSYSSSKAAVIVLTQNLAAMTRAHGIYVFGLRPGFVRTALLEKGAQLPAARRWVPEIQAVLDSGRTVPAERAARLVTVLASGRADSLSGLTVSIDTDLEALMSKGDDVRREGRYILRLCE